MSRLVVTLETPRTGADRRELVLGSIPFELHKFFPRYGLQDLAKALDAADRAA